MSLKPSRLKSEPKSASEDVAWIITRISATPARYLTQVYVPDTEADIAVTAFQASGENELAV
jgi:hypothetical protein